MTLLPVVTRELRVASRRRSSHSSRVASALIAILLCGWLILTVPKLSFFTTMLGAVFFKVLSWFAFLYALISGVKTTADTISSEKRQGTLGLLFLTDLKGYDVLLGKLAASSLDTLYGVVAIIPVLAIPLLMGGVTAGEFARVGLAVLATLLFSLSAGMFASSISYVERKAAGAAFLIIGFVAGGIPLAAALIKDGLGKRQLAETIRIISPSSAVSAAFAAGYSTKATEYWLSLSLTVFFCALMLLIASSATSRVWVDKPQRLGEFAWRDKWRRALRGSAEAQRLFRRRLLDINAVYWLGSRDRHVRFYPWLFLLCMAGIWCWGRFIDRDFVGLQASMGAFCVIHFIFKYWFATMACYGFSTDRDRASFELILSTPLSVSDILKGQWLALGRLFLWPFVVLVVVEFLLTVWNTVYPSILDARTLSEVFIMWIIFGVCGVILLVLDCVALGWLGFWQSLFSKTPHQAATTAMVGVVWIPLLLFCVSLLGLIPFAGALEYPAFALVLWFVIGLVTDVIFIAVVRQKFRLNLRYVVSERSAARLPKS